MAAYAGRVVGYLPDYEASVYSHMDYTALTQLNYFGLTPTSAGALPSSSTDGYSFTQLSGVVTAAHAVGVPVSITLDPSTPFTTIDTSTTASAALATNLAAFCSKYHLDGIDLDWEPTSPTAAQLTNYASLIAALYAQTEPAGLTLSIAASASQHIVTPATAADLNWICVMDYDLEYNASAPYSDSVSYMTSWASTGISKSKLIEGVPFYGRSGTSWDNSTTETYAQILSAYASANGGALPGTNVDSVTINGVTWGFNSPSDMTEKAQFVLSNGYGGMGVWEMGQDDFVASQSAYNLMATIKSAMAAAAPSWQVTGSGAAFSSFAMANGGAGGLTIGAGTVTLSADAGSTIPTFAVTAETGGTLAITSTQHLASLTLSGGSASYTAAGSGVIELGSLAISGLSATLNLGAHDMIVHNGNLTQITAQITTGFDGAGGAWTGVGITSSAAAVTAGMALGVELNNDGHGNTLKSTFDNQSVVNTDVLVRYTVFGDADLSGTVTLADYLLIDAGFAVGATGWHNGDFNYDHVINGDDYSLIDNAFNTQSQVAAALPALMVAAPPSVVAGRPVETVASTQRAPQAVPSALPPPLVVATLSSWAPAIGSADGSAFNDTPLDDLLRSAGGSAAAAG